MWTIRGPARRVIGEASIISLFLLLAVAMTWPLAAHLRNAVSWPEDPFFTTWTLDWDYYATFHHASLFDANIFYPARDSLAFSEHIYGIALFFFPLFALGVAPLTIHNLAIVIGFAACGYFMFLLARWITESEAAGIVAGVLFAFVGIRFHHLAHVPYIWSCWLPLILLAVLMLHERPTIGRATFLGIALAMNGLTTMHWLVFGTTAAAIVVVFLAFVTGSYRDARYWLLAAAAFAFAALVWLPFAIPYFRVMRIYGMTRDFSDALPNSGEWRDWLVPNVQNALYGKWSPGENYGHERTLFPGIVACVLLLVGIFFGKRSDLAASIRTFPDAHTPPTAALRLLDVLIVLSAFLAAFGFAAGRVEMRWLSYNGAATPLVLLVVFVFARLCLRVPGTSFGLAEAIQRSRLSLPVWGSIVWLAVGALGARGLRGAFHTFLFTHISPFRGIRMPVRWVMIAYVGIAVLVAFGVKVVLRNRTRTMRIAITGILAALMLFELRSAPIRWYLLPESPRPVYDWLASVPIHGGILELPMTQGAAYDYLWRSTVHHKPLLNGVSSYIPPDYENLIRLYEREPVPDEFLSSLEQRRCSLVVVHDGWLRAHSAAVRDWISRGISSGRIVFVRRFDAGTRADYVFALTAIEPHASAWRAPDVPDPSGRTPMQNADVFLQSDGWTYSNLPVANIDIGPGWIVRGPLTVSGWALAPSGVSSVTIRFDNGRYSFPASRVDRPDVKAFLPWYPNDPRPGFTATFSRRPHGIRRDTDLQIEIVDREGNRRQQPPFWFSWRPPLKNPPVWNDAELDALLSRLGVDAARAHPALGGGTAAIQDYTDSLVSSEEKETDREYVERLVRVLLDSTSAHDSSRYLELLASGTSRERVLQQLLTSPEFGHKYLRSGTIEFD